MNAHIITLLNVSGIAKRNGGLPLVRAVKIGAITLMSRLVSPKNRALRSLFDILTRCLKLTRELWPYTFPLGYQSASIIPI
jgi:hypothetical protein